MKKGILFFACLALLCSCTGTAGSTPADTTAAPTTEPTTEPVPTPEPTAEPPAGPRVISGEEMPEPLRIESIEGMGLNEYDTPEVEAEVFFEAEGSIRTALVVHEGTLYFGTNESQFFAVDLATGEALWQVETEAAPQTRPVVQDRKVVFNVMNSLYILDAATGDTLHKVDYPCDATTRVSYQDYAYNDSYVAVADGIAYFAALDGDIVAVDIAAGAISWSLPAEHPGWVPAGIDYLDGALYFVDNVGFLCRVDVVTHEMTTMTQIRDRVFAPLLIEEGKIYAGGRSCNVFCVDAATGEGLWSSFSYDVTTWFSGGSVVQGDTLYTCTSDEYTLLALDKNTGEFQRLYPIETNGYTPPLLRGENVVVAATSAYTLKNTHIMEFDTQNHVKLWQADLEAGTLSAPAMDGDALYVGTEIGTVYKIDMPV